MLRVIFKKYNILENFNFSKNAYGLIQVCRETEILGIGKFNELSKMCNRNGNFRLMSDIETDVRSINVDGKYYYVCSFKAYRQCIICPIVILYSVSILF